MSGTPGHSGGKRPGAGRPVSSRTLRSGQTLLYHEADPTGQWLPGGLVTVEIVSRTKLVLRHADGSAIVLGY